MAKYVGYEYRIELVKDGKYGAKIYPGNDNLTGWNGMMGELINGVNAAADGDFLNRLLWL